MFSKINPLQIVRDHVDTLTSARSRKISKGDLLLFFGFPGAIAATLAIMKITLTDDAGSVLINAFAIFAGLLLNLLVLVHHLIRRYAEAPAEKLGRALLRSLYANLSYGILIAIITLIPLMANAFTKNEHASTILSGLVFFLLSNFLLTLLMILKRVHALLSREFLARPSETDPED